MRRSCRTMEPEVTLSKPAIMRKVEVLPHPDEPRSATISPFSTAMSSERTACTAGRPRLRYTLSTLRSSSVPMVIALRSRGLPPVRQRDAKPGFAIEQLHGLLRKADKHGVVGDDLRRTGAQRPQPFPAVLEPEQQHRLLVHRRDRENARSDGLLAGGKGNVEMLRAHAEPVRPVRRKRFSRTQQHPRPRDRGKQHAVLGKRRYLPQIDAGIAKQPRTATDAGL